MKELKIDLSELADAFDVGDMPGAFYLDTETGEVVMVSDECMRIAEKNDADEESRPLADWEQKEVAKAVEVLNGYGERFLRVPRQDSREGYRDMEEFVNTVDDARLAELLEVALDGKGAFRRFKDVLSRFPDQRQRWFSFQNERVRQRVVEWLEDCGIKPIE